VNLYLAFLGEIFAIFHRRYRSFFYFDDLYLFTNCVGVIPIYSLNCRLKKYTSEKLQSSAICVTV